MAHWFHRNKLKSTIDQKFADKGTAIKSNASKEQNFKNFIFEQFLKNLYFNFLATKKNY